MRIENTIRLCCLILAAAIASAAGDSLAGRWMIDSSAQAGQVQVTLHRGDGHSDSTSSFPIGWQSLHGLSRAQVDAAAAQNLGFDIVREAGAFRCEGYFKAGNGAGTFSFTPNLSFAVELFGGR